MRGNCDAEYHKDAAEPTLDKLHADGIGYDVLGGGRIQVTNWDVAVLALRRLGPARVPAGASPLDLVDRRGRAPTELASAGGNGQRDQRAGARAMHAGLQQGFELAAHVICATPPRPRHSEPWNGR